MPENAGGTNARANTRSDCLNERELSRKRWLQTSRIIEAGIHNLAKLQRDCRMLQRKTELVEAQTTNGAADERLEANDAVGMRWAGKSRSKFAYKLTDKATESVANRQMDVFVR